MCRISRELVDRLEPNLKTWLGFGDLARILKVKAELNNVMRALRGHVFSAKNTTISYIL